LLYLAALLSFTPIKAQVIFDDNTDQLIVDFDSTLTGVNNGSYNGSGLESVPNLGRLDGNAWSITGLSDGNHLFGQINVSGDFARGMSSGGVSTGGMYAFQVAPNNKAIGFQPISNDMTPGTITLKITNNKTLSILAFNIDYSIITRNDQNRSSSLNFSYSFDNSTFTSHSGSAYTSPGNMDSNPTWVMSSRHIIINNISIPPGQSFYIRWTTNDNGGSGNRDEISIDDITVTTTVNSNICSEPSTQPTNLTFSDVRSNSISGIFNYAVADKFLVVQTETSTLNTLPSDGTSYTSGEILGNGKVIDYSNKGFYNSIGLLPLTTYYYHIFSANDNCSSGPEYKTDSPLTGNVQTAVDNNADYYSGLSGLTCESLKTALHLLIDEHTQSSYAYLWTLFQASDERTNDAGNQTIVWDMYSDNPSGIESEFVFISDQCGSYLNEGECYNREHSFPKSWWGGAIDNPQYTDAFHVIPVDGYMNGIRSNLPYGEVQAGTETYVSANGSRKGSSSISIPGYGGSVFEPIDSYKGDLARNYFYMATRYEDIISGWENSMYESDAILDGSSYTVFEPWFLDLLISWHMNDPVSTKEVERNDAIYDYQGNRNPFIDHPEYVSLIWGSSCSGVSDCPSSYSAVNGNALSGFQVLSEDFETDGIIESTQTISGANTILDYDSGTSIVLKPGFQIQVGVTFTAVIDGCGGTQ